MKYKVNDWVRHIHNSEVVVKVESVEEDCFQSSFSWCCSYEEFQPWIPLPNEWFFDGAHKELLKNESFDGYQLVSFNQHRKGFNSLLKNCEPFNGELPEFLKKI
jgi:hypothetical protein